MRAIGPAELLDVWEAGTTQPRWQWASALIRAAWPEIDAAQAEALTIGQRDRRLLELREALFGPQLQCQTNCPSCRATAEMNVHTAELRESARHSKHGELAVVRAAKSACDLAPVRHVLCTGDWTMDFRVPNVGDLVATATARDPAELRDQLLSRCVHVHRDGGRSIEAGELPASAIDQVIAAMSATDPEADLWLDLACPECGRRWTEAFDIVAYLWAEFDGWAQRTLHDVHVLAMAYGWSESEVLALSPTRRAHYRAMIDA